MKLLYIAGPYRSETPEGIKANITMAQHVGARAADRGWTPMVPHNMSAGLELLGDEFWLDATMELLKRCDAVLLVPGYQESAGTMAEIEEAVSRGMSIFEMHDLPEFSSWVDPEKDRAAGKALSDLGLRRRERGPESYRMILEKRAQRREETNHG